MSKEKYDDKRNVIYRVFPNFNDLEEWYKYDENNNMIHAKSSSGFEQWNKYDKNGNKIYCKDTSGYESWWEYEDDMMINITDQILQKKEFLKRKPTSRFELMEID